MKKIILSFTCATILTSSFAMNTPVQKVSPAQPSTQSPAITTQQAQTKSALWQWIKANPILSTSLFAYAAAVVVGNMAFGFDALYPYKTSEMNDLEEVIPDEEYVNFSLYSNRNTSENLKKYLKSEHKFDVHNPQKYDEIIETKEYLSHEKDYEKLTKNKTDGKSFGQRLSTFFTPSIIIQNGRKKCPLTAKRLNRFYIHTQGSHFSSWSSAFDAIIGFSNIRNLVHFFSNKQKDKIDNYLEIPSIKKNREEWAQQNKEGLGEDRVKKTLEAIYDQSSLNPAAFLLVQVYFAFIICLFLAAIDTGIAFIFHKNNPELKNKNLLIAFFRKIFRRNDNPVPTTK